MKSIPCFFISKTLTELFYMFPIGRSLSTKMETSTLHVNSNSTTLSSPTNSSISLHPRRYGLRFPAYLRLFYSPVSYLLEFSGVLPSRPDQSESQPLTTSNGTGTRNVSTIVAYDGVSPEISRIDCINSSSSSGDEVAISVIGREEIDRVRNVVYDDDGDSVDIGVRSVDEGSQGRGFGSAAPVDFSGEGTIASVGVDIRNIEGFQLLVRRLDEILPFSLLLLLVFIRQHLQGVVICIWIIAFMFKSNDILRKQTALKGERKVAVLVSYLLVFVLHVFGIYYCCQDDDLYYPLFMVPPKSIPPFWHAIFIILVNDTMVRQVGMSLKLMLLMCYKNDGGHNFPREGQMLTLVEYTVLLYCALLPAPVWYRFFLNKEYETLFSLLATGLYIVLKLIKTVKKVDSFVAALKALSRKEIHYRSYATAEQVNAAGDICSICQEKMQTPILLECKHIFCEDCAAEWFERERTCPLCRASIIPADLQLYGDGSTNLVFQIF